LIVNAVAFLRDARIVEPIFADFTLIHCPRILLYLAPAPAFAIAVEAGKVVPAVVAVPVHNVIRKLFELWDKLALASLGTITEKVAPGPDFFDLMPALAVARNSTGIAEGAWFIVSKSIGTICANVQILARRSHVPGALIEFEGQGCGCIKLQLPLLLQVLAQCQSLCALGRS
jgi:hypothetical protein